jgi:N6-adenosine-specific RNA methylase IME4
MVDLLSLPRRYKLVYVDPAWEYYGDPDKPQAAGKHYNTMPLDEMMALPVRQLIDEVGVVFMWATGPKLADAIDLLRAWGFHYRCIAYFWIKTTKAGKVIEGQGVRPSFVKQLGEVVIVGSTEPQLGEVVIVGSTEPRGRTLPILTESQGQNIFAPRPDDEHSRKPEEARWRIDELYGDIPKIELFARCRYPGWDAWGLEADGPMASSQARSPKLKARLEEREAYATAMALMRELTQED